MAAVRDLTAPDGTGPMTRGCFEAPAEFGHLGRDLAASATRFALARTGESRVSRVNQPALVATMSHRIQKLLVLVGGAVLVALGAGASYRPF